MRYGRIKIYAGSTGKRFAKRMCAYLGQELGDADTIRFSDGNICQTLFFGAPESLQMVIAAMKLKTLPLWKKSYDQPR